MIASVHSGARLGNLKLFKTPLPPWIMATSVIFGCRLHKMSKVVCTAHYISGRGPLSGRKMVVQDAWPNMGTYSLCMGKLPLPGCSWPRCESPAARTTCETALSVHRPRIVVVEEQTQRDIDITARRGLVGSDGSTKPGRPGRKSGSHTPSFCRRIVRRPQVRHERCPLTGTSRVYRRSRPRSHVVCIRELHEVLKAVPGGGDHNAGRRAARGQGVDNVHTSLAGQPAAFPPAVGHRKQETATKNFRKWCPDHVISTISRHE